MSFLRSYTHFSAIRFPQTSKAGSGSDPRHIVIGVSLFHDSSPLHLSISPQNCLSLQAQSSNTKEGQLALSAVCVQERALQGTSFGLGHADIMACTNELECVPGGVGVLVYCDVAMAAMVKVNSYEMYKPTMAERMWKKQTKPKLILQLICKERRNCCDLKGNQQCTLTSLCCVVSGSSWPALFSSQAPKTIVPVFGGTRGRGMCVCLLAVWWVFEGVEGSIWIVISLSKSVPLLSDDKTVNKCCTVSS